MLRRADSIAFWIATGTSRALPRPKPTLTIAIANHGERRKGENATALDSFSNAVDLDEFLNQSFFFDFFRISHDATLRTADRLHAPHPLALSRGRGTVTTAIEGNSFNTGSFGALSKSAHLR